MRHHHRQQQYSTLILVIPWDQTQASPLLPWKHHQPPLLLNLPPWIHEIAKEEKSLGYPLLLDIILDRIERHHQLY